MNRKLAASTLALTLVLAGCGRCDDDRHGGKGRYGGSEAASNEVRQTEAGLLAALKAKDPGRVAAFYADDAVLATPGAPPAIGRDAIARANAESFRDPAFNLDFTNEKTEIARSGEMAYTRGSFRLTFTDPATGRPQSLAGSYVTVFRKQGDGSWKAIADYVTPGSAEASPTLPLPPPKAGGAVKATTPSIPIPPPAE